MRTSNVLFPLPKWQRKQVKPSELSIAVSRGAIGKTPATYLTDQRFDRAKQLLASGRNVKEVAAAVGFKSESSFRAAFNFRFDLPPSAFARVARAR
jgi:transcriptional regulator GlxA family with amidase domain